jgi:hypothetical protein
MGESIFLTIEAIKTNKECSNFLGKPLDSAAAKRQEIPNSAGGAGLAPSQSCATAGPSSQSSSGSLLRDRGKHPISAYRQRTFGRHHERDVKHYG